MWRNTGVCFWKKCQAAWDNDNSCMELCLSGIGFTWKGKWGGGPTTLCRIAMVPVQECILARQGSPGRAISCTDLCGFLDGKGAKGRPMSHFHRWAGNLFNAGRRLDGKSQPGERKISENKKYCNTEQIPTFGGDVSSILAKFFLLVNLGCLKVTRHLLKKDFSCPVEFFSSSQGEDQGCNFSSLCCPYVVQSVAVRIKCPSPLKTKTHT